MFLSGTYQAPRVNACLTGRLTRPKALALLPMVARWHTCVETQLLNTLPTLTLARIPRPVQPPIGYLFRSSFLGGARLPSAF